MRRTIFSQFFCVSIGFSPSQYRVSKILHLKMAILDS